MKMQNVRRIHGVLALVGVCAGQTWGCGDDDSPSPQTQGWLSDSGAGDAGPETVATTATAGSSAATTDSTSSSVGLMEAGSATVLDASDTNEVDSGVEDSGVDGGTQAVDAFVSPLMDALVADPDISVFMSLVARGGLEKELERGGPYTLFIPTNDAFALLPSSLIDDQSNKAAAEIVSHHIVKEVLTLAQLKSQSEVTDLSHTPLALGVRAGDLVVEGLTQVTDADLSYGASTVHKVDSVMLPWPFPGTIADVVDAYPILGDLQARVSNDERSALSEDDLTLFAPINGGFADLPGAPDGGDAGDAGETDWSPIVDYHVVAGHVAEQQLLLGGVLQSTAGPFMGLDVRQGLEVNDGTKRVPVVYADIEVDSGSHGSVIHLIEQALVPPPPILEVLQELGQDDLLFRFDVEQVPGQTDSFSAVLSGEGPFTVLAPRVSAFADLPSGNLSGPPSTTLGLHVVPDVVDSAELRALNGAPGPATLSDSTTPTFRAPSVGGHLLIDGLVGITTPDIPAANGVIHLLDALVVPQDVTFGGTMNQAIAYFPSLSTLSSAVAGNTAVNTALSTTTSSLTLFAPLNEAFDALPGTPTGDLTLFLQRHVLVGVDNSAALASTYPTPTAVMMSGGESVTIDGASLTVDEAHIVGFDLKTRSGILHTLDGVLGDVDLALPDNDAGTGDAGANDAGL